MYKILFIILCVLSTTASATQDIELIVIRSQHQLLVVQNDVVLHSFRSAFGSGGRKAKLQRGDHTTPKGIYRIKKIRDSARFHLFLQLDYPNISDAIDGLESELINETEYNAILDAHIAGVLPPQNTRLGGAIGIHGIGHETQDRIEIHQIADWTQGCIALRNHEVEIVKNYIKMGTQVQIID